MEYIIGSFWILLELICFALFSNAFLVRKAGSVKCWSVFTIAFGSIFVFTNIIGVAPLQQLVTIASYICTSFALYRGSWIRHMLIVVLLFVFAMAIDSVMVYGASLLLGIGYEALIWKKLTYITVVTIGKLFEVLIAYIVFCFQPTASKQHIQKKCLALLLLFPAVSLTVMITIFTTYTLEDDLSVGAFVLCTVLGLTNIANVYLVRNMEQSALKEQEMLLVNQQMDIQTQSILELEKQYKLQRQATHEHQRQLQTIHDLITTNKVDTAQIYIEELRGKQATRLCAINSHHPIIDAVLNHKYQIAKERSIEMQIQVNDLSDVKLGADEIVVLLSNLLDNAIEACEKIPERRMIYCRILLGDNLFLSVRNSSLPVVITDGVMQTSKPRKKDHGFGMMGIRHVLDRHHAEYTYQYENGWFQFVAEIPLGN